MTNRLSSLNRASFDIVPAGRAMPDRAVEPAALVIDRDPARSPFIAALAAAGPPVDTDKVRRIRDAIAAGVYRVDADAVARAILANR